MATGRVPTTANSPLTAKGDLFGYSTTQARVPVGADGETIVADSSTSTGLRYTAGTVQANPVLNSAFQVWQRGTSISLAASTGYTSGFVADRYQTGTGANQAVTVSRQATGDTTNLPFIQYALRYQRNSGQTGTGALYLVQSFESINSVPFAGKTVTFSFYARAGANYSQTGNGFTVLLRSGTGTDQNLITAGYTGSVDVINQTAVLTTTWQRFTYTASVGATATELGFLFGFTPTGTAGANDYYDITGIQIDIGSVALPFRTYAGTLQGELAACQRYFWSWSGNGLVAEIRSASQAYASMKLPITMRTAPTATFLASPTTAYTVNSAGKSGGIASIGQDSSSADIYTFSIGLSGYTAGQSGFFFGNSGTQFSAEL